MAKVSKLKPANKAPVKCIALFEEYQGILVEEAKVL
jgi:hypothetical protein